MSLEYSQKSVAIETKTFFIRGVRITEPTFKSKTLNMEGNKRHPQFTLESDTNRHTSSLSERFYHAHLLHAEGSSTSGNDR